MFAVEAFLTRKESGKDYSSIKTIKIRKLKKKCSSKRMKYFILLKFSLGGKYCNTRLVSRIFKVSNLFRLVFSSSYSPASASRVLGLWIHTIISVAKISLNLTNRKQRTQLKNGQEIWTDISPDEKHHGKKAHENYSTSYVTGDCKVKLWCTHMSWNGWDPNTKTTNS